MDESFVTTEFSCGVHLKNVLHGKQDHLILVENSKEEAFHNTMELHRLFVDVLRLRRNNQEPQPLPINIKWVVYNL